MTNGKIAKIFYEMAKLLTIQEVDFKPAAYEKAANSVVLLKQDVGDVYKKGGMVGLENIPGVGKSIAEKIKEYIKTGRVEEYEELKKKMPVDVLGLSAVDGVGPRMIKVFYEKLKIKNLEDLEKAARAGEISKLPRAGKKLEKKILDWIEFYKKSLKDSRAEKFEGLENKSLRLVEEKDVLGDLHVHAHFNVDKNFIEKMINGAVGLGYQYIGISDHTKFLRIEHGLNEKELLEQRKQIKNLKFKNLKILQGCEANILADGSIDISNEVLEKLDYVIAGVHSQMKMPKEEMTERIIRAMENPNVDIISHPTGRILQRRDEYPLDFEKVLEAAKRTGTVLEINANPCRLDLKYSNIKKAKDEGIKMIIGSDAHQPDQLALMKYGVLEARRGGAEKKDIVNTMSFEEIFDFFKKPKNRRF